MAKRISDAEFSDADGVADWRVLFWGAKTSFDTDDFAHHVVNIATWQGRE
ncbi:hypothetical protein [Arthrobacter sp. ZGTC412]|nr:hypothetical protein [Arthrobacter sp. ZGTC412]